MARKMNPKAHLKSAALEASRGARHGVPGTEMSVGSGLSRYRKRRPIVVDATPKDVTSQPVRPTATIDIATLSVADQMAA